MTYEEKLQAIVKAQVEGGHNEYSFYLGQMSHTKFEIANGYIWDDNGHKYEAVLYILLDTKGLEATCPLNTFANSTNENTYIRQDIAMSHKILDAWHSEEGNNWKAAIDTAYDLLP